MTFEVLIQGAEKSFKNAEQLFHEAELLVAGGAIPRAFCLHQISLEECAKAEKLGVWAISLALSLPVEQKKALASIQSHKAKNRANAYHLRLSDGEREARGRNDREAVIEAFRQFQNEFHERSNLAKNASLYVNWVDGQFEAPNEKITKKMVGEIKARNEEFLGLNYAALRMLKRMHESPREMQKLVDLLFGLMCDLKKMRENSPDDRSEASINVMSAFLEAAIDALDEDP